VDQQLEARVRAHAPIPVQNLYYLLCYAWNQLEQGQVVEVSAMSSDVPADLFATVLIKGIEHLRRRGLNVGTAPNTKFSPASEGGSKSLKRSDGFWRSMVARLVTLMNLRLILLQTGSSNRR
jgi:hypothetical protein